MSIVPVNRFLKAIDQFGVIPGDDFLIINRKRFAMFGGLAMNAGALMWVIICFITGKYEQSLIPLSFIAISIFNLLFFRKVNKFDLAVISQTFFALILPFAFQYHLGGISASGCVMIWGLVSLTVSISFNNLNLSLIWLCLFLLLVVISGMIEPGLVSRIHSDISSNSKILLLILNLSMVSFFISLLVLFFVRENIRSYSELKSAQHHIIQSERISALGTLSAGIAHEINNPLAIIKALSEEEITEGRDIYNRFFNICHSVSSDQFILIENILLRNAPSMDLLSTAEERELISRLSVELQEVGISNARSYASNLVRAGYTSIPTEFRSLPENLLPELIELLSLVTQREKNFKIIFNASEKAARIVRNMKVYLHNPLNHEKEEVDINESIASVLNIYENMLKQGIDLTFDKSDIPKIMGFRSELSLVWTNLIMNALQAMENKGSLKIETKFEQNFVRVSISDSGPGIEASIQNKIFSDIFTTKARGEGTGYGLNLVKKMINTHSGRIWFESEVGIGTTFHVELPVS